MRALIVTSEAPPTVSGISRTVGRLAEGLRARGHVIDTVSSTEIPRIVFGEVRLSSFAIHWPEVRRKLRQYDVVNLHGPVPTLSDVFLAMTRFTRRSSRTPVLYTHHSAIEIEGMLKATDVYNGLHRWLSHVADRTVTTSRFYRDSLFAPSARNVSVIPWGVDPVPGSSRRALREPGQPLRVLFVGQMRPYKGVDVLLDAVIGRDDLRLTLVGAGPDLEKHERTVRSRGAENVHFLGRVSDAELDRAYQENDVIVLPSVTRAEAFGLVVLEGMVRGLVPVVSELPGVRDVAEGAGVVVPPRDAAALRRALVELAADPSTVALLHQRSLERAAELSWDSTIDAYEALMLELAAEKTDHRLIDVRDGRTAHVLPRQVLRGSTGARRRVSRTRVVPGVAVSTSEAATLEALVDPPPVEPVA
ncbi:glycosyltransferase family 4 protein [Kineococcus sp. SYSU DK006]|uniref:glycosyltransferase family 4 protein n=1 Tax=Kineococcus sp. SYSU DK006 TaxID=3383127 RepID=UPI003D7EBEC5